MAYASVAEFVEAVTPAEATALARATLPATGYDATLIQRALNDATAELDTYFAAKYSTPLDPIPRTANRAAIALAREQLDRQGRDAVKAEAARVRAWARDVARGVAVLGGGDAGVDVPASDSASGVQISSSERVFTDERLGGYLS